MKCIFLGGDNKNLNCGEKEEPQIKKFNEIKVKVLEVGICGTDRELIAGQRGSPPKDEKDLIIGHEMLSRVVEIGSGVTSFKKGDLAVFTVRRGCNKCANCLQDRADLCCSNEYTERGIEKRDGFQSEYVVDEEKFLIQVPRSLRSCGVLTEPTSVVEKAIEVAIGIQNSRLPDWSTSEKQALVVGLGPIGLLACIVLRIRGFKVLGQGVEDSTSTRAKIVEEIGGTYIDGRQTSFKQVGEKFGQIDVIIEAVGLAKIEFDLMEALGFNGVCVMTGVPDKSSILSTAGGQFMSTLVLKNQVLAGSVNAAKKHWEFAVRDLALAQKKWPTVLEKLITSRTLYSQFEKAFDPKNKEEIKSVVVWDDAPCK